MNIQENWSAIQTHFENSFKSSLHVSIASVDAGNTPTITPIGTFFLTDDYGGFYFEKFTTSLPKNANRKICILGVNSRKSFWLKSLIQTEFIKHPGIKLYGTLGEKRKASPQEIQLLQERIRKTKFTKGHQYLWGDMEYVREVNIEGAEKLNIGKMTEQL